MELLYIYFLFFLLFFLFVKQKKDKVAFLIMLLLYLLGSIAAILVYDKLYKGYILSVEAILFHISMIFLLLYPLQEFDSVSKNSIERSDYKLVRGFSIFVIFICLLKISTDIPNINISVMFSDVSFLRNALEEGAFRESNVIIRYLNFFAGQYWSVALVLAFYFMLHYPSKRLIIIFLLISSLGIIISGFRVAAREYLVKYVFILFILTYWFSDKINKHWKHFLKKTGILLGGVFCFFFLLITFLRFGNSSRFDSPVTSMLSYLGQGFIHFSSYFNEFSEGVTGGAIRFPFFAGKSMSAYNISEHIYTNADLNVFSTTIGSWIFELGIVWTVIITFLHNYIFKRVGKSQMTIYKLIYIIWIYDFIFSALFFYNEVLNTSRIASILLIVFLDYISNKKYSKNIISS